MQKARAASWGLGMAVQGMTAHPHHLRPYLWEPLQQQRGAQPLPWLCFQRRAPRQHRPRQGQRCCKPMCWEVQWCLEQAMQQAQASLHQRSAPHRGSPLQSE